MQMMMAIDPGVSTGWALFTSHSPSTGWGLLGCGSDDPRNIWLEKLTPLKLDTVVIEVPQIYRASLMKGDPNDIIKLAVRVGQYAEFFRVKGCEVKLFKPAEWKGQVPKPVHHKRIRELLQGHNEIFTVEQAEKELNKKQREDMMDAIGLGKWYISHGRGLPRPDWMAT